MSLDSFLNAIRPLIPKPLFRLLISPYHYLLAYVGAKKYRFPSAQLKILAVTGTKGKTSTTELLNAILEEAGYMTALANTIRFKVGSEEKRNLFKMTMPGRFFQQRFLAQARDAQCDFVIMEMSSEGARQHRHRFIDLDALIVTNLAPEHIESHGSFEKYREAKLNIARALSRSAKGRRRFVINADDENLKPFGAIPHVEIVPYSLGAVVPYRGDDAGSAFTFHGVTIISKLPGLFNVYNMLAAATLAKELGVPAEVIKHALEKVDTILGRAQRIEAGQHFPVIVDYAHTAESLESLYKAFEGYRRICVLGNTGGGRDRWKRPKMGAIADTYCDDIILTNEDPYDENPRAIIADMEEGIRNHTPHIVIDRREAIATAFQMAQKNGSRKSVVLITGKGTDPYIMEARGKKTPWSDAGVAREELEKVIS